MIFHYFFPNSRTAIRILIAIPGMFLIVNFVNTSFGDEHMVSLLMKGNYFKKKKFKKIIQENIEIIYLLPLKT